MVFKAIGELCRDVIADLDAKGKKGSTEAEPSLLSDEGENEPRREVGVGTKEPSPARERRPVLTARYNVKYLGVANPTRSPNGATPNYLMLVWSEGHSNLANSPCRTAAAAQ